MSKLEQSEAERRETGEPKLLTDIRKGAEQGHRYLEQVKVSGQAANPQTPPSRFISSTYSSPGSVLGREEDAVVIELNTRYLLAGIQGESSPQCKIKFGPEGSRRVGDYRAWLPGYKKQRESLESWGELYELWRNDIDTLDLSLVADKFERAVREAYTKHLLVDIGTARLVLSLPSIVPHLVLETLLSTLFERWQYPVITLLPSPTMTTISAGLRSALVVDVGWEETVVTSIYEYREIGTHRSTRAMKELTRHVATSLRPVVEGLQTSATFRYDLDFVEEVIYRVIPFIRMDDGPPSNESVDGTSVATLEEPSRTASPGPDAVDIEWPTDVSTEFVTIPTKMFSSAISAVLLDTAADVYPDEHELALTSIIFKALLSLAYDERSACMSRIIFTGVGPEIPGLSRIVLQSLTALAINSGWSGIRGRHLKTDRAGLSEVAQARAHVPDARYGSFPAAGKDYVEERVRKQRAKSSQPTVSTDLREVMSLGPWAGASLLSSLRVRGFVEIERERFLSHGLAGASRETDISVMPQPQRMSSFGISKPAKGPDRTSWTLAGWG